jgi:hypothetical protein
MLSSCTRTRIAGASQNFACALGGDENAHCLISSFGESLSSLVGAFSPDISRRDELRTSLFSSEPDPNDEPCKRSN